MLLPAGFWGDRNVLQLLRMLHLFINVKMFIPLHRDEPICGWQKGIAGKGRMSK